MKFQCLRAKVETKEAAVLAVLRACDFLSLVVYVCE